MTNEPPAHPSARPDRWVRCQQLLLGWCLLSIVTLPFIPFLWLSELPVLVLIQLPKLTLANWLRLHVVMPAIKVFGYSSGNFSPDFILARPYALAIAYLIALVPLVAITGWHARKTGRRPGWLTFFLLVAILIDYLATLAFGHTRSLTIY